MLLLTPGLLPRAIGVMQFKPKFTEVFNKWQAINWLLAVRFLLFGARDVWFVVGLPVFLYTTLGWTFTQVGSFLALWVIGYGIIQAVAPQILRQHATCPWARWRERETLGRAIDAGAGGNGDAATDLGRPAHNGGHCWTGAVRDSFCH